MLLDFLRHLLEDGRASFPWPGGVFMMPADVVQGILARILPRVDAAGHAPAPLTFVVAGRTLTLPGTMTLNVRQALVTNALALAEALPGAALENLRLPVDVMADGMTECEFTLHPVDSPPSPA